MQFDIRDFW